MNKKTLKLTVGAMQLQDENCLAAVKFSEDDKGEKTPQLEMVGYSGGIIKGHWYWGDLAIDLAGMSIPKTKIPILSEHRIDHKIAFVKKGEINFKDNQLNISGGTFLDNTISQSFQDDSAKGFPFEASIYARPTQIQSLAENETADVNGYTMKGPGTIWRKATLKEVSVCTFGYDSNTKSAAMSENEELNIEYQEAVKTNQEEETTRMDFLTFKKENPEEFAKLSAEVEAGLAEKFNAEKADLEGKIAAAVAENTKLSEENKGNEKRLMALEKNEEIRKEAAMKHSADAVFTEKFNAAGLPDRLSIKVRKMVSHEQFIKDGTFDKEAFGAAVDAELKDWATDDEGSVHGFSTFTKNLDNPGDTKLSKACEDAATRMLASINGAKK